MSRQSRFLQRLKHFWLTLGPGLITGASDDDPSAITTFSQAGALFGTDLLWTAPLAFPILSFIQEICARIGIITGKGLTHIIRTHYPGWVLYLCIALSCPAFLMNIGADIAALGEAGSLLLPSVSPVYWSICFTLLLFILMLWLPFRRLAAVMKYICIVLLIYVLVPFINHADLNRTAIQGLIPHMHFNKDFLLILTGLTGSIISPYIFFWQTSAEAEEKSNLGRKKRITKYTFLLMRKDILSGAFFAVLIMFFIILASGTILHKHGITNIDNIRDAALALRPLAGRLSFVLFSIGIIGTGCLIIPVLSTTISTILTEAFDRKTGLNRSFREARLFYALIALAMCFGITMHWMRLSTVRTLLLTTTMYGITAPLIFGIILHIANRKDIMGAFCNNRISNIAGMLILLLMLGTLAGLLVVAFL
jgi:NRAMP (natural resistance-associated macrophage protein)-like metal ion transporter